jgi:hypothetical protein
MDWNNFGEVFKLVEVPTMFLFPEYTEGLLTVDQAREILCPLASRFADCWRSGFTGWREGVTPETRSRLTSTTRAGIIHNLAISRAKELFPAGDDGARICEAIGFFKLYVQNKAIVRLKRVGRDFLAANVKTKQQKRYYAQAHVDGVTDGLTRITVGYQLNLAQTDIDRIVAGLQIGKDLIWHFDITDEAGGIAAPIPIHPVDPGATPKVRPAVHKKAQSNE